MKPEHWIAFVQISITLVGMFIGPWLAIKWSIQQFRSTKSWEQSTQAYSDLLRQLAILKHTNRLYYDHYISRRMMDDNSYAQCAAGHQDAKRAVEQLSIANAFISQATQKAIYSLISCLEDYREDIVAQLEEDSIQIDACITVMTTEAPKRAEQ
jgi:uncharacterized membrane protein YccC